jgi:hypothetical protein
MTHRASDRSTGPRLLWYALWLNVLVWLVGFALYESKSYFEVNDALQVFSVFGVIWAGVLGLFSISEPYELSPRQERTISQAPAWRKIFTLIHGPGAARGRWAFLLLSALSLVIGTIGMLLDAQDYEENLVLYAWILTGYLCILFVVSDWCYRGFARRWLDTVGLRRGFILLVAALWVLAPIIIGAALEMGSVNYSIITLFSPIMGLAEIIENQAGYRDVLAVIYTIVGIIALAVLMFQATRLRVTTYRVTALADDKNPRGE